MGSNAPAVAKGAQVQVQGGVCGADVLHVAQVEGGLVAQVWPLLHKGHQFSVPHGVGRRLFQRVNKGHFHRFIGVGLVAQAVGKTQVCGEVGGGGQDLAEAKVYPQSVRSPLSLGPSAVKSRRLVRWVRL